MSDVAVQIELAVSMAGGDQATAQLREMADKLTGMGGSASDFDAAIDQTRAALSAAAAASAETASALELQQAKYNQLERAAVKAAQAVEKAQLSGKPTGDLQASADAAAAALSKEAAALDKMREAASKASAEEKKLGAALKNLEGAAKGADAAAARAASGNGKLSETTKKAIGPVGEMIERGMAIKQTLGSMGWAGAAMLAAGAVLLLTGAVFTGIAALAKFAVTSNKVAMEKLNKGTERLKGNIGKLFKDVGVEKFVEAFENVISLFEEGTAVSNALKAIVEAILQPLFGQSTAIGAIVKEMFRGMVYGALLTAIAIVKLRNAIKEMLPEGALSGFDALKVAWYAGIAAAFTLAAGLVVLTAVFGLIAVAMILTTIPLMLLIAAILILAAIIFAPIIGLILLIAYFDEITAALGSFGSAAYQAAADLIVGLVNGITSGAGAVWEAVKNMASGAINALKSTLGIASPSKVFALQGKFTGEGFVQGVEGEQRNVQGALESMASPADVEGGAPAAAASAARGSITLTGPFIFNGVEGAEDAYSRFDAMLTKAVSGDVGSLGGLEPAT